MDNVHGKEISLQYVTVKVPGQKPRGSRTVNSIQEHTPVANQNKAEENPKKNEKVLLTSFEMLKDPSGGEENADLNGTFNEKTSETPNVKKRPRRIKSNSVKANQDSEGKFLINLFHIRSLLLIMHIL